MRINLVEKKNVAEIFFGVFVVIGVKMGNIVILEFINFVWRVFFLELEYILSMV